MQLEMQSFYLVSIEMASSNGVQEKAYKTILLSVVDSFGMSVESMPFYSLS